MQRTYPDNGTKFRYKVIFGILLWIISVTSSCSPLLAPYVNQAWLIIVICGIAPLVVLTLKVGHLGGKLINHIPLTTALIAMLATAITQVIAANDLPSGLAPLHSLPDSKIIYLTIGSALAFVLTWLQLTHEKWASGGTALAAAGLYGSVIFFRVSAVQEVGEVYVVMSGFLIIFGLSHKNEPRHLHKNEIDFWKWTAFFVGVLFLATINSPVPGQSFDYILNMALLICLVGCAAFFLRGFPEQKTAAWVILFFGAGLPVTLALIKTLDIATVFDRTLLFSYRLHPTELGGANILARSLLITAPLGVALLLAKRSEKLLTRIQKWGLIFLEFLILMIILYSRSFEGFFAWLAAFSVFLAFFFWETIHTFWKKTGTRFVVRSTVILVLALFAGVALFLSVKLAHNVNVFSFNTRFSHWIGAIAAIQNHPLLGGGPDNEYLYTKYSGNLTPIIVSQDILDDPLYVVRYRSGLQKLHGHNTLLETAAFTGLAGVAGLLGIGYALIKIGLTTWRRGDQQQRLLAAACLAGIAGELSWGLLDVTRETPPFFSFPIWAIIGLLLALSRYPSSEQTELVRAKPLLEKLKYRHVLLGLAVFIISISSLASNQYASGFLAFQEHRWSDAAQNFQIAANLDPLSAHYRWMLSKVELENGQYEQARQNLEKAISLKRGYSPYLAQAGWLAWLLDDLTSAEQYFEEAIANDPLEGWTPGLYANLGLLKAYQGFQEEAVPLFAKSLEYHPELAIAPYWISVQLPGDSFELVLDAAYYAGALKSDLRLRLLSQLGLSNITSDNFDFGPSPIETLRLSSVLDILQQKYISQINQNDPDAYLTLAAQAEAARLSGLYDRAQDCYIAYQNLRPTSSYGYRDLALVYIAQNQLEQAQASLEQANQISPNDLETTKLLAELALQQNDLSRAKNVLELTTTIAGGDSFHLRSFDVEIVNLWRNLYSSNGDIDDEIQMLKWIAVIRGAPEDYLALADTEQTAPDEVVNDCWQAYEILVKTWAQPYDVRFWTVAVCLANSTLSEQQISEDVAKIDTQYYRSLILGHIFRLRDQVDLAEKNYREAIQYRNDDGSAHYFLGDLYVAINDFSKSENEFTTAADLNPYEPLPLIALGNLYKASSDYARAIDAYQNAVMRSPGREESHFTLANLYYKVGEYSEAKKYYESGIQASQTTTTGELFNFISNMTEAVYSQNIVHDYIKGDVFEINGEEKPILFMHPESWADYTLRLPEIENNEKILLNFWIGISPDVWDQPGDGVTFSVTLRSSGISQEIYHAYLDPKNDITDRRWHPASIDLTAVAGREVVLTFKTTAGTSGDNRFDWAGWGAPYIAIIQQEP